MLEFVCVCVWVWVCVCVYVCVYVCVCGFWLPHQPNQSFTCRDAGAASHLGLTTHLGETAGGRGWLSYPPAFTVGVGVDRRSAVVPITSDVAGNLNTMCHVLGRITDTAKASDLERAEPGYESMAQFAVDTDNVADMMRSIDFQTGTKDNRTIHKHNTVSAARSKQYAWEEESIGYKLLLLSCTLWIWWLRCTFFSTMILTVLMLCNKLALLK